MVVVVVVVPISILLFVVLLRLQIHPLSSATTGNTTEAMADSRRRREIWGVHILENEISSEVSTGNRARGIETNTSVTIQI